MIVIVALKEQSLEWLLQLPEGSMSIHETLK